MAEGAEASTYRLGVKDPIEGTADDGFMQELSTLVEKGAASERLGIFEEQIVSVSPVLERHSELTMVAFFWQSWMWKEGIK